jgi:hypothetical protein
MRPRGVVGSQQAAVLIDLAAIHFAVMTRAILITRCA